LADQQQQQKALQRAFQSTTRSVATGSRRYGSNRYGGNRYGSGRYSRNGSSVYSRPYRQASYAQRSMLYQQQQMALVVQNWPLLQMQAMANYQRMLQQAVMQRMQMQQAMMATYLRQQSASHRVVQRHQNPAVRAPARKR
jgi:hypothetical protein